MKAYGRPIDLKFDFVQFFRKTRVRFCPCSAEHPVSSLAYKVNDSVSLRQDGQRCCLELAQDHHSSTHIDAFRSFS